MQNSNEKKILGTVPKKLQFIENFWDCPEFSKGKNKGITLIALIITIIVMLILVGVTINVALNGGLFSKGKKAAYQTNASSIKEQLAIAKVVKLADNNGNTMSDYGISIDDLQLPDALEDEYGEKLVISKDANLYYDSTKVTAEEADWLEEIGITEYSVIDDDGNDSENGEKNIEESDDFIWGYDNNNNIYYMGSANEFKFTSDEVQAKLIVITETEGKGVPAAIEFAENAEVVTKMISESDNLYMTNFNTGTGPSVIDFNGTTVINPENYDDPKGTQRLILGDYVVTVKGLEEWGLIPYYSFDDAPNLKNITIPDSVKTISSNAFWNNKNIERIEIPSSVTTIGNLAFGADLGQKIALANIKVNRTLKDAEATLGTDWIPSGATVTYTDQAKTY